MVLGIEVGIAVIGRPETQIVLTRMCILCLALALHFRVSAIFRSGCVDFIPAERKLVHVVKALGIRQVDAGSIGVDDGSQLQLGQLEATTALNGRHVEAEIPIGRIIRAIELELKLRVADGS